MSMSISDDLFLAILAMDSYNRVDAPGLTVEGDEIGTATLRTDLLPEGWQDASFFAQAYTLANGKTVISYRGTDDVVADAATGFGLGVGDEDSTQGKLAAQFYRAVNGDSIDPNPNIILTGHSLGGGLAGFVGTIYGAQFKLFDNMAFELAATSK
jgi:hypothetical protein